MGCTTSKSALDCELLVGFLSNIFHDGLHREWRTFLRERAVIVYNFRKILGISMGILNSKFMSWNLLLLLLITA